MTMSLRRLLERTANYIEHLGKNPELVSALRSERDATEASLLIVQISVKRFVIAEQNTARMAKVISRPLKRHVAERVLDQLLTEDCRHYSDETSDALLDRPITH